MAAAAVMEAPGRSLRRLGAHYPRVWRLIWQASPRYAALAVAVTLATTLVEPAQAFITKVIIDRVGVALVAPAGLDWQYLFAPLAAIAGLWLLDAACASLTQGLRETLGVQLQNHINYMVLKKSSELDLAFFEAPEFYDMMENARNESWRAYTLAYFVVDLGAALLSLFAMLALLVRLHPLAIVVLLVTSVPQAISITFYANRRFTLLTGRATAQRMIDYLATLLGTRLAVKEIRLFGLENYFLDRYRHYCQRFFHENKALLFSEQRASLFTNLIANAGTIAIWGYAIYQASLGRLTIGDLALIFTASQASRTHLKQLCYSLGVFYESSLFVGNLFKLLDLPPQAVEGALSLAKGTRPVPARLAEGIEFRNVSFRYPRSEQFVLRDLSFRISPGTSVALVGQNGAGKTTIVKLLARFYDPTEGVVLLDGRDLREYDINDLRRNIGVIFQDFVRYDFTLRENIGYGKIEDIEDRERIMSAAALGGATEVVTRLTNGLDTMLGRTFEEGTDLSGGEWQKVALSRAYMREAQIIVLDEPTSALDALAEQEVYDRFAHLTKDRATLFISHRFSTVRMADKIIVLDEGRIIEQGNHEQLIVLAGLYAKMFKTQAQPYL